MPDVFLFLNEHVEQRNSKTPQEWDFFSSLLTVSPVLRKASFEGLVLTTPDPAVLDRRASGVMQNKDIHFTPTTSFLGKAATMRC